jgi:hypothetical protein
MGCGQLSGKITKGFVMSEIDPVRHVNAKRAYGEVGGHYDFGLACNYPARFHFEDGWSYVSIYQCSNEDRTAHWVVYVGWWRDPCSFYYRTLMDLYEDITDPGYQTKEEERALKKFLSSQGNALRLLAVWEEKIRLFDHDTPYDLGKFHGEMMQEISNKLHGGAQGVPGHIGSEGCWGEHELGPQGQA